MSPLAQALSAALLHFVWQGAVVGFLLWIALTVLGRRAADARYLAGCAALAVLAALPLVTTAVLYRHALPPALPGGMAPFAASSHAADEVVQTVAAVWSGADPRRALWLARVQMWALPAWSVGVLLFSLRPVCGSAHAFVLGRRGERADASVLATVVSLAARMEIDRAVRVVVSTRLDSPSVLGWLRPVILLPPATAMGLTPRQLEAVLAHELAHIRRHDYLVNILQMVVETLLFYHPAVWWSSRQIRRERESCCDDQAVRYCGDVVTYARALTTLEKRRVATPSLIIGSTGGPLLDRIQRLLGVTPRDFSPSPWPAVVAIGLGLVGVALNLTWVGAQTRSGPRLAFDAAAVKPNAPGDRLRVNHPNFANGVLTMRNLTLGTMIRAAYGPAFPLPLPEDRMTGGPDWMEGDRFTIEASAGRPVRADEMAAMLKTLLEDRFKLVARMETRQLPVYVLGLVALDGQPGGQLHRSEIDCEKTPRCGIGGGPGRFTLGASPISLLAMSLSELVNRPVLDRTGLTGTFDGNLEWTPEPEEFEHFGGPSADRPVSNGPSLFTALKEQFGLKLESAKGPVEFLVVARAERPTED